MNRYFPAIPSLIMLMVLVACKPANQPEPQNDFAVLAQPADDFIQAKAGRQLTFPSDHGAHNDYRIEWWYLTANLLGEDGGSYGVQWTLFRFAVTPTAEFNVSPDTHNNQLFMAHVGITTPVTHYSFQRYARGSDAGTVARTGVVSRPFSAWLDDWIMQSTGAGWLPLEVRARQDDVGFHLQLQSDQPPVLQGIDGFSQKHPDGGGSYYYSQPFLMANGELTLGGQKIAVSGNAWLDREWGSQFLQKDQSGWDWFSLHLDSGEKLMLFQLRNRQENEPGANYLHGALFDPTGGKILLSPDQIQLKVLETSLVGGRSLPMKWRIELPQIQRQFVVQALHDNQWMQVDFPYWEGVVTVSGSGPGNTGQGYMELTGYSKTLTNTR